MTILLKILYRLLFNHSCIIFMSVELFQKRRMSIICYTYQNSRRMKNKSEQKNKFELNNCKKAVFLPLIEIWNKKY